MPDISVQPRGTSRNNPEPTVTVCDEGKEAYFTFHDGGVVVDIFSEDGTASSEMVITYDQLWSLVQ